MKKYYYNYSSAFYKTFITAELTKTESILKANDITSKLTNWKHY